MDTNVEILIDHACLRGINATFSSGGCILCSLESNVDAIDDAIIRSNGALYEIA